MSLVAVTRVYHESLRTSLRACINKQSNEAAEMMIRWSEMSLSVRLTLRIYII